MKLRIQRFSGMPVAMENLAAYDTEFKARYDDIMAKYSPDMLEVHKHLQELDAELQAKWNQIESEPVPKSAKGWQRLIAKYQAPVMLAQSAENSKELLLIIMDQPLAWQVVR